MGCFPSAAFVNSKKEVSHMSRSFIEENAQQREKLRTLLSRLSDRELAHPLYADWTVVGVLGHLAFWDYRALVLIRRWKQMGVKEPSAMDVNAINDAMRPLLLAIPPRKAAEIVLEAAAAIDKEIEGLSPDLIAQIEALGSSFRLNRGTHRLEHMDQIESALSLKK
jgi:hypothetical protein